MSANLEQIESILLEKQRARKRINKRNWYARHKNEPGFSEKMYGYVKNYRNKKKQGLINRLGDI